MELADKFEIIKKWGKTITWGDTKYTEAEFREHLRGSEFFSAFKLDLINKIKETQVEVIEEETEKE